MSVDGYFAGPGGELDWYLVDASFNAFAIEQLQAADTLLFGRKTYELMKNYWPNPMAEQNDRVVTELMNNTPKIVFSTTLDKAEWNNTRLVKDNIAGEISMIKQQPGKDLLLLGSAQLASTLIQLNLIDEFRIMINPVVLGRGRPLFTGIQNRSQLTLIKTRPFASGNIFTGIYTRRFNVRVMKNCI